MTTLAALALLASMFHAPLPDIPVKDEALARRFAAGRAMLHSLRQQLNVRRIPYRDDLGTVVIGPPEFERRFFPCNIKEGIYITDNRWAKGVATTVTEAVAAAERWHDLVDGREP
jgi:hypothetical protein